MKNLFLLAFILIANTTFAQKDTVGLNTPFNDGAVVYERVVNTPGQSKPLLFDNAHLWFIKHYNSLNSLQIQNEYTGRVVGTGAELIKFKAILGIEVVSNLTFTVQIDCKNNKYRCKVYNIIVEFETDDKKRVFTSAEDLRNNILGNRNEMVNPVIFNKNQSKKILQSVNVAIDSLMDSLKKTMIDKDDF